MWAVVQRKKITAIAAGSPCSASAVLLPGITATFTTATSSLEVHPTHISPTVYKTDLGIYYFTFSPPNAPPISAPLVGILTLMIPQSEPEGPIHLKIVAGLVVKIELDKPWATLLLIAMASSSVYHNHFNTLYHKWQVPVQRESIPCMSLYEE